MDKVLFPLWTTIPLDGLEPYEKGSYAIANVNRTRSWEHEWSAIFDMKQAEGETHTEFDKRMVAAQYPLMAKIIKEIVLKQGGEVFEAKPVTLETLKYLDEELDGRVMNFIAMETNERNAARTTNASAPFRAERIRVLASGGKAEVASPNGSDKPVVADKSN